MKNSEKTLWDIRPYSKSELAQAYAPEISPASAVRRLTRWIHGDPEFYEALRKAGYTDKQRVFTISQVRIIFDYIGRPEG